MVASKVGKIAPIGLGKRDAKFAVSFLSAVIAAPIGRARKARQRSNRSINRAQQRTNENQIRRFAQLITPITPSSTGDVPCSLERQQNLFEELAGKLLLGAQLPDPQAFPRLGSGESDYGFECITCTL